ncbi:hypothetical protein TcasGA2_TC005493 [Tribolium castaneum]|uniref:peroxidase n=1 Tax=Tribolium castaneum TaxID=7070 RepID=D6WXZ9_TRICA|nr:PREDICTED: uncharacterized protein LOC656619 [Tribolium castaneum]EFA09156.2 hypothetical protein TcasGA2_TC005493 [Tribolium castaneum]|eukprot:XP_008197187.1 PREDICTED: uncharacterized protein LOC656619 [Tribolium castaneum]
MEVTFGLALLALLPAALSATNITAYTRALPSELKPTVRAALGAELNAPRPCQSHDAVPCPPNKYRRPSGECNNVRHAHWGTRGVPFLRLLPPDYADGRSQPRQSVTTHALPSPLDVAVTLQTVPATPHESVTALLGAWSELLLHDLASTGNLKSQDCCSDGRKHGECYGRVGHGQCREYMRTLPAIDMDDCDFEYRNQMNLASSFLDASAIYGNTDQQVEKLRTYDAGLVNVSACTSCRSNALYSAILKEHNRVAINLAQLNRHWTDETLFLESKRIVTAMLQHITYNEFLPIVLGNEAIVQSDLQLQSHGRFSKYSSSHRAGVYNEVAMSALPALLSMIPTTLMNETVESFAEMVDVLIRTPAQSPSMHMMVPLRADWDTAALFVHMGRDHGIPPYAHYLSKCQNLTIEKFDDFTKAGISPELLKALKYLYQVPEDVDLLVGSLLERPIPGAIVGGTLECLLREQFILLKQSDRFWYENDLPPSSLTTEQLAEIKKVTLAGLLCANTDDLDKIQPKAFVQEDPYLNARLSCDQHPLPQLTPWLEMDHMADLSEDLLMEALVKAEQEVLERRKTEYELWATVGGIDPKSPAGTAASFSKANKQALKLANTSLLFEFASNEIINSLMHRRRKRQIFDNNVISSVFRDELSDGLQNVDISSLIPANAIDLDTHCEETGPCDPNTPYRTMTGHCNNLRNPNWGKSLTTFSRLLPSAYDDGISKPRLLGATGVPLPSPRIVSTLIHPDISNLHSRYTLMIMQYGQFLDHDLTMTPIHKGFHESIPDCRSCDSPRTVHPECNPFPIPPSDHYYPEINITSGQRMCFPFMRSLPGQLHLGPREQVNQNTAFLDASQIYGENPCVLKELKGYGGRMNCTQRPLKLKDLLPQSDHHPECKAGSGLCFIAGDGRASEQPGLTVIHTIFMREHNRMVEGLKQVNPHWDDQKLFEHARRINIAANQHITYNEWLPRILSWNAVNLYGLKLLPQGYYKDYNPSCNPAILTEFAAAAFRIGHSLLRPHIPRLSPSYQIIDPPILLRDGFFKPDMLLQTGMVDEIARGLVSTPMETLDQFITGEVTNHLFEDRKIPFSGVDLIALNIQRARDHGIPSYNNYRALCNLKRASNFEDLAREIPPEVIARFKRIYPTVDDIDLFPGGLSERPLQGGLVGPTFACIIAIQFRQLRKCDRFWYENHDPTVRFSEAQLAEIRKVTLAKIICDNLDVHGDMQRAAFDLPSNFLNPRVPCDSLPKLDFGAWRESVGSGCVIGDRMVEVGQSAFPTPCTSCICTQEGGQCASLRVTDCSQLLREWPKEVVLRDDVCSAQCGFLLRNEGPQPGLNTDLTPPPRHLRARQLGRPPRIPSRGFNGFGEFKLPDLSVFVAK